MSELYHFENILATMKAHFKQACLEHSVNFNSEMLHVNYSCI